MSTLEAHVKKLESCRFLTAEQDEGDERRGIGCARAIGSCGSIGKDFEEICREHPGGLRPIYEERQNAP